MKLNKSFNMENKNGFLVTCVCSILLLLTLCYFGVNSGSKGTHSYLNSAENDQLSFTTYSCDDGKELGTYYLCGDANSDGDIDCRIYENQCINYSSTTTTCQMLGSEWKKNDFVYLGDSFDTLTAVWKSSGCFNSTMSSSNPNGDSYSRFYDENCVLTSTTTHSAYNYCTRSSDNSSVYCTVTASDPNSIGLQHCDLYKAQGYSCEVASFENYTCATGFFEDADSTTFSCVYGTSGYGDYKANDKVYVNATILGESTANSYKCPCPGDEWTKYGDASCVQTITENYSYYSYELGDLEKCYNGYTLKNGQCILPKFSLTYDANDGWFSGATTLTFYADSGYLSTSMTISSGVPTRAGYDFVEWNSKADGTGNSYSSGSKITISADTTLYAQWTASGSTTTKYTVTLDGNGGTVYGNTETTMDIEVEAGKTINYLYPASRSGYTFNGWYTAASGGTRVGTTGDSYTPTGNVTLYAQWTASGSTTTKYTVTLDGNGGTVYGNTETTMDIEVEAGKSINYLYPASRSGYTFNGWYTAASGGTRVGTTGDSYTPTGNVTLYAQWTASGSTGTPNTCSDSISNDNTTIWTKSSCNGTYINGKLYVWSDSQSCCLIRNVYYINYAYNGGSAGENAPKSGVVGYGTLPSTIISSTKYDYLLISKPNKTVVITGNKNGTNANIGSATSKAQTFAGWTFSGGNTSTAKYGTSSSTITTSWSNANTKVTAEYFKNLSSTSGATVKMTANWTAVAMKVPTITSPTGYTCVWNTKADGSGETYTSGQSYTPSATSESSISLYADCSPNTYSVSYSGNGSTSGSMSNSSHTYDKSSTLTKNTYVKTNYTFIGWNTKADGSGTSYADGASIKNLTSTKNGEVKLYAQWSSSSTELRTATLTIEEDSTSMKVDENASFEFTYTGDSANSKISCTSSNKNVVECIIDSGKLKLNSKSKGTATVTVNASATSTYKSAQDKIIVIVTDDASGGDETPTENKFTATFDANGGALNGNNNKSCTTTGTNCDITNLPSATRNGYTFKGWGTGSTCNSGEKNKLTLNADTTYYACWSNNDTTGNPSLDDDGNVDSNVQTGDSAIALVWFFGLFAIGYAFYYFKNIKQN